MKYKEYKSNLFSLLMREKKYALEVYNALNDSNIDDPEKIEIFILENTGLQLSVRNDASFIIDDNLSIYEHQSTTCGNMPVRFLIYYSGLIKEYVKNRNLFGTRTIRIPAPRFVVFYNGRLDRPEREEIRLSDAFIREEERPNIELVATIINLNEGEEPNVFLGKCKVLKDYQRVVDKIRRKQEIEELEDAINEALDECIEEGILAEFLQQHRKEIFESMVIDCTYERQLELERIEQEKELLLEKQRADNAEQRADSAEQRADNAEQRAKESKELAIRNNISVYIEFKIPEEEIIKRVKNDYDILECEIKALIQELKEK